MVDFILERMNKEEPLDKIVEDLLHDIISPDYTKTSKTCSFNCIDGVGCDNMTCIIVRFKH